MNFDLQIFKSQGSLNKNDQMSSNQRQIYILKSLAISPGEDSLARKKSPMVSVRFSENGPKTLKIWKMDHLWKHFTPKKDFFSTTPKNSFANLAIFVYFRPWGIDWARFQLDWSIIWGDMAFQSWDLLFKKNPFLSRFCYVINFDPTVLKHPYCFHEWLKSRNDDSF